MKHAAILMLLLACPAGIALAGQDQPPSADELLRLYSQRVRDELLPRLDELEHHQLLLSATTIGAEMLYPHRQLLFEKAKNTLADLPKLDLGSPDSWEELPTSGDNLVRALAATLVDNKASAPPEADQDAVVFALLWDPVKVAGMVRVQFMIHSLGYDKYHKMATLDALVGPAVYAVDADPEHPAIAFDAKSELLLVNLVRAKAGHYTDEKVRRLRRKAAASQPTSTPAAQEPARAAATATQPSAHQERNDPAATAKAFFTTLARKDYEAALSYVSPSDRVAFRKELPRIQHATSLPSFPAEPEVHVVSVKEHHGVQVAEVALTNSEGLGTDMRLAGGKWWVVRSNSLDPFENFSAKQLLAKIVAASEFDERAEMSSYFIQRLKEDNQTISEQCRQLIDEMVGQPDASERQHLATKIGRNLADH